MVAEEGGDGGAGDRRGAEAGRVPVGVAAGGARCGPHVHWGHGSAGLRVEVAGKPCGRKLFGPANAESGHQSS